MDDSHHKTSFHCVPEAMRTQKKGLFTRNIFSLESANKQTKTNETNESSLGLVFILQGHFAFSEGFGPFLEREKEKYATPPHPPLPPTNQKQFVFGQNGEKWKTTSISLSLLGPSSYLGFS